ncbi:recombinase family protein [Nocardia sp. CA-107356]|uniref:recombinase family protein n=1 Tax=Nocardia sp. CA-107356 TaxID=3239972 RepID=UPI003D8B80D6
MNSPDRGSAVAPEGGAPAVLFMSFARTPKNQDLQREIGIRRADESKLRLVHEIVEVGSAATPYDKRWALNALFGYLDEHPDVRHVLLPSLGRVSRSWQNLGPILKEFENRHVVIVTFDGRRVTDLDMAIMCSGFNKLLNFEGPTHLGRGLHDA